MAVDARLQKEISEAIAKLKGVSKAAGRASNRALTKAARPLIQEIRQNAPRSDEPHYRYSTPKLVGGLRAPKGEGRKVATYMPGNLERSFKVLKFRRSAAVFVGPKLDKTGSGGLFAGARTDAYYAHWVEYGAPAAGIPARPFVRPAVQSQQDNVLRIAVNELKLAIEQYAKEVAVR